MNKKTTLLLGCATLMTLSACAGTASPAQTGSQTTPSAKTTIASQTVTDSSTTKVGQIITDNDESTASSSTTSNSSTTTTIMNKEQQLAAAQKGDTVVLMNTSLGEIKIKLFSKEVPETVKNFIELAKAGKYNNVPFHRVIKDFMIQGGDFENKNGTGGYSYKGPGTTIKDEVKPNLKHYYGTLSMAKTAAPNSGGSQFFIVSSPNGTPWLDGVHTVFGQVFEGMDIVEKIQSTETDAMDRPLQEITIQSIEIEQ